MKIGNNESENCSIITLENDYLFIYYYLKMKKYKSQHLLYLLQYDELEDFDFLKEIINKKNTEKLNNFLDINLKKNSV